MPHHSIRRDNHGIRSVELCSGFDYIKTDTEKQGRIFNAAPNIPIHAIVSLTERIHERSVPPSAPDEDPTIAVAVPDWESAA